ncbi:hypothetical protein SERLADRAFT_354116, partial [Serpula lacrymans var. lacrymans S7.9]
MQDSPFALSESFLVAGDGDIACLVHNQMKRMKERGILVGEESVIKEVSSTTFAGGVETTASKLLMFLLAMALNPTIQVRAQAEIDSIIGSET